MEGTHMANETEIQRWRRVVAEERARLARIDPKGVRETRADLERYERRLAGLERAQ
jgi:hypothetical protein